jgi:N-acetylneuraminic acid mutarotase
LVTGGISIFIVANAEIYNPSTGIWSPTGNLTTPRLLHSAALTRNGTVLVVGGLDTAGKPLASAELGVRGQ